MSLTLPGSGATLGVRVLSAEMIKTTRSRLEIRQDPDKTASLVGALLVAFGSVEALSSAAALFAQWIAPHDRGFLLPSLRLALAVLFTVSGWFFLRRRSRVVLDLEHRMVARYLGVGGPASGGNRTWDLDEFSFASLERTSRRRNWAGGVLDLWVIRLSRPDGSELELYRTRDEGDAQATAMGVASFAGLPLRGR